MTRVLFAVDGSEPSRRALAYAEHLDTGGEVTIVTVAPTLIEAPHTAEYTDPHSDLGRMRGVLQEAVDALQAVGVKAEPVLVAGNPAGEIIRMAEERAIQLIVVGSRGQHALERFLVGSIVERLVHHAPCDVLVVR